MIGPMEIGKAVASTRGKMTQVELGEKLGIGQGELSKIERGKQSLPVDRMIAIEMACQRPPGFLLRAAGYLNAEVSLTEVILTTPELPDEVRPFVLGGIAAAQAAAKGSVSAVKRGARHAKDHPHGRA